MKRISVASLSVLCIVEMEKPLCDDWKGLPGKPCMGDEMILELRVLLVLLVVVTCPKVP